MRTPWGAEACGWPVSTPLAYIGTTRRREGFAINDTEGALDGRIRGRTGGVGRSVRRDDAPQRALNRDGGLEGPARASGGWLRASQRALPHSYAYLTVLISGSDRLRRP